MRRLDLEFAERRPRWPAAALALVGVLLAGDAVSNWLQLRERAREAAETAAGVPRAAPTGEPMSDSMRREFDSARRLVAATIHEHRRDDAGRRGTELRPISPKQAT